MTVDEWYDGDGKLNLTITWDEHDPVESQFNDWTEEDFLTAIRNACDKELSMGDNVCTQISEGLHPSRECQEDLSSV